MDQTASARPRTRPSSGVVLLAAAAAMGGAAAYLVLTGETRAAGAAAAAAGAVLFASDRAVRTDGAPRLVFAGSLTERAIDAALLGAIAWEFLPSEPRTGAAALVALSLSYVASYLPIKARGLGFDSEEPRAAQPLRSLAVTGGLLSGGVEAALWAAAAVSLAAAAVTLAGLAGDGGRA